MAPQLFVPRRGPVRKIAMSFRQWAHHGVETREIVRKAAALCEHLLRAHPDRELIMLSTCQGLPQYLDDSRVAREVVDGLPPEVRSRCRIDGQRYGPQALIQRYAEADAYIGMRLHGAILSMLGGTPAMAIAYEDKTPGIYSSLGFERYQVDHRASEQEWLACADGFLGAIDDIRAALPSVLDAAVASLDRAAEVLRGAARKDASAVRRPAEPVATAV
jgi:colanic acid/amylovoran biosynthesis protein